MFQRIAILFILLIASAALADVCSMITKDQAQSAANLLKIHPNFVKYCATCANKSKAKVRAEKVDVRAVGQDNPRWVLFVNDENIDLAFAYLDIGENNGINLAKLSGCEITSDIPGTIDLSDALAESKAVATNETKNIPEPISTSQPSAPVSIENPLRDADQHFQKKDFNAAVRLYEDYVEKNPSEFNAFKSKISTCYYNLGVQLIQKASTREDCRKAGDYFSHCLFLDQNDASALEGLRVAKVCKEIGPNLPKLQSEIENLKLRQ
jgi:hypothetical protein